LPNGSSWLGAGAAIVENVAASPTFKLQNSVIVWSEQFGWF
jgi:hypothetical protein